MRNVKTLVENWSIRNGWKPVLSLGQKVWGPVFMQLRNTVARNVYHQIVPQIDRQIYLREDDEL